MAIERDSVVAAARAWLGVPWRHMGRSRLGLDCVGLLVVVGRDLGLEVEDQERYPRRPQGGYLRQTLERQLVDGGRTPAPGDIGLFADRRTPFHAGIFSLRYGRLHMIHAYAKRRKVVEEPFDHEWPGLLDRVYALPRIVPWPS
jgi:cell wall-associated NlpC family hydrolase